PLLDRFDVVIKIVNPNPEAIVALPEDLRVAAERTCATDDMDRRISLRRWKSFAQLREHVGEDAAGRAVFGAHYGDVIDALKLSRGKVPKDTSAPPKDDTKRPEPADEAGKTLPAAY